ncbi:MAG: hypothetical protein AAGD96_09315, partial [Chloroflexota bacterium]
MLQDQERDHAGEKGDSYHSCRPMSGYKIFCGGLETAQGEEKVDLTASKNLSDLTYLKTFTAFSML